jgi:FKBP-type peptidyl-prolyl cis-trans isomerase SlpA
MIKEKNVVELHYTGKFKEGGEVFDSSVEREPLKVEVGNGSLIKGFEQSLLGKEKGEKYSIEIKPEEAYGDIKENLIVEIPKDKMPGPVEVGQTLSANAENGGSAQVIIKEVKEETVVIDGNHPLAGKELLFDIEIVTVTTNESE